MWTKTNLETQLKQFRSKRVSSEDILNEIQTVLAENDRERAKIYKRLTTEIAGNEINNLIINTLKGEQIYHISDIKKLCVEYRLRFLDSHFFKKQIPAEAISKIRQLEREQNTSFQQFKIVAPAKLLKLENADDPLLFVPLENDYYYLVHKWGNDLHPLRKWLMWPYKSFENLVFAIFLISIVMTALVPLHIFNGGHEAKPQEYLLMFLFMFKSIGGIVLFYGFAKGKNFNTAIWNSKYYNG